ncbi:HNH endonuclease [Saccharothrix sp. AJ9571]|nr:HNH endonuclease [Saccharothrix sp. AJ9571]
MSITDVTREAVVAAIAEHDRLGVDEFRKRHKFGQAWVYILLHDGREYDSKAIVGVAHGYLPGRSPLAASDFSGGQNTVVQVLERLGFTVRKSERLLWLRDELVLACDLVARNDWQGVRSSDPRAIELSTLLQSLPLYPREARGHNFRSPDSVQLKTSNIATQHPSYGGVRTRGGKLDREVLFDFLNRPEEMHAQAAAIRAGVDTGELSTLPPTPDIDEEIAASEGRTLVLLHLRRERDPKLRAKKLNQVITNHGRIACEVCGFDFERTYGARGSGYAEVHHVVPLHVTGQTKTRLVDLAVLCANCHRMIHRGSQWLTPVELRDLVLLHAQSLAEHPLV